MFFFIATKRDPCKHRVCYMFPSNITKIRWIAIFLSPPSHPKWCFKPTKKEHVASPDDSRAILREQLPPRNRISDHKSLKFLGIRSFTCNTNKWPLQRTPASRHILRWWMGCSSTSSAWIEPKNLTPKKGDPRKKRDFEELGPRLKSATVGCFVPSIARGGEVGRSFCQGVWDGCIPEQWSFHPGHLLYKRDESSYPVT